MADNSAHPTTSTDDDTNFKANLPRSTLLYQNKVLEHALEVEVATHGDARRRCVELQNELAAKKADIQNLDQVIARASEDKAAAEAAAAELEQKLRDCLERAERAEQVSDELLSNLHSRKAEVDALQLMVADLDACVADREQDFRRLVAAKEAAEAREASLESARLETESRLIEERANLIALVRTIEAETERVLFETTKQARALEERRAEEAAARIKSLEATICDLESREADAHRVAAESAAEALRIRQETAAVEAERDALVRDVSKLKEAPRPGAWRTKVAAAVEVFKNALQNALVSVSSDPDWIERFHAEAMDTFRAIDRRVVTNFGARDCIPPMWEMTVQAVSERVVANSLAGLATAPNFDDAVAEVIEALLAEQIAKPARFGAEYESCLSTGRGRLRSAMQSFVQSEGTEALTTIVFAGNDPHDVYDELYERSDSPLKFFSNNRRAKEAIKLALSSALATVAKCGGEMIVSVLAKELETILAREAGALVSEFVYCHGGVVDDGTCAGADPDCV